MAKTQITLAIETAISGGSLTLFDGDSVLDEWVGESQVSRSEELIEAISAMLKRNNTKPCELTELIVSRGPGSLTGVRIGLATATGLKNGLNIKCFGISVFDVFYNKWGNSQLDIITAVSFGKNEVCFQHFNQLDQHFDINYNINYNRNFNQKIEKNGVKNSTENDLLKTASLEEFVRFLEFAANENYKTRIIANDKLYNSIEAYSIYNSELVEVINSGRNLSEHFRIKDFKKNESDNLKPFYID